MAGESIGGGPEGQRLFASWGYQVIPWPEGAAGPDSYIHLQLQSRDLIQEFVASIKIISFLTRLSVFGWIESCRFFL